MADCMGQVLGKYHLIRLLRRSNLAEVSQSEHIFTMRPFIIKLLQTSFSSRKKRKKFLQEARLLAKLKHLYILPIIDIGVHEGFHYLVTEYDPNGSLCDLLEHYYQRPMSREEVVIILAILDRIHKSCDKSRL